MLSGSGVVSPVQLTTMRNGLRLDVWIVGVVFTVCLLGIAGAAYRFNVAGIQDLLPRSVASEDKSNVSRMEIAANATSGVTPREIPAGARRENSVPQHVPQSTRTLTPPVVARSTIPQPIRPVPGDAGRVLSKRTEATASVTVATSPEQQRKVFQPLGYVQKANGSVEAFITQPDNTVAVIHAGDAYDVGGEKFTVAGITSRGVEIVAAAAPQVSFSAVESVSNSAPSLESSAEVLTASVRQVKNTLAANRQSAEGSSVQRLRSGKIISRQSGIGILAARKLVVLESSTVRSSNLQLPLANSISPGPKAIGYAEKSDGTRVAFVADGESVRLVPDGKRWTAPSETPKTLAASGNLKASPSSASRANLTQPDRNQNYAAARRAPEAWNVKNQRATGSNSALAINSAPTSPAYRTLSFSDNKVALLPTRRSVINPTRAAATSEEAVTTPVRTEASPTTIGFVARANGKITAIVDDVKGQGIHFVPVRDSNPPALVAAARSMYPVELPTKDAGRLLPQPHIRQPDNIPARNITIEAVSTDSHAASASPGTRSRAARTAEVTHSGAPESEMSVVSSGPPPLTSEPYVPPPRPEIGTEGIERAERQGETLRDQELRAVAATPPAADPTTLLASGAPASMPAAEPTEIASVRELPNSLLFENLSLPIEQRLDLLGQSSRAFAPSANGTLDFWHGKLPAAERLMDLATPHEKPPPRFDRSSGLEEGLTDRSPDAPVMPPVEPGTPDSRASRPAVPGALKPQAVGAEDNDSSPSITYLGYVEWQGGRILAVVDDSEEGVRLVHDGDIVGDRYRVVKVQAGSVDIVELSAGSATPIAVQSPTSKNNGYVAKGGGKLRSPRIQKASSLHSSMNNSSAPLATAHR